MFHTLSVCVYVRESNVVCRHKHISIMETVPEYRVQNFIIFFLEGEIRTIILDSIRKLDWFWSLGHCVLRSLGSSSSAS